MVQSPEQQAELAIQLDTNAMGVPSRTRHTKKFPVAALSRNGESLTKIHKEILRYLEKGYTKQQTAKKMGLNVHTFDGHLRDIYKIVDAHTMTAAVAKAIRTKII